MIPANDCRKLAILLVDGESGFRTSLAEMLRDDGHEVRDYAAPSELPSVAALGGMALMITDFDMAGQSGVELADELHAARPGLPVIMLSAYGFAMLEANVGARPFVRLAEKPVDYAALHALVHEIAGCAPPTY
jgi:two-component system nitrogen regulation response regulator NtrX